MKIKISNILAVSEIEWYNQKQDLLKNLPLKTQWTIRKNMKALESFAQDFLNFRQELEEQKNNEWFVEGNGKCEKTTDEDGNEILKILEDKMEEFTAYNDKLNQQINEIAFEEIEVEVTPIDLDSIISIIDEQKLEFNMDDMDMLSLFED